MGTTREWRLDRDAAAFYDARFVPAIFAEIAEIVAGAAALRGGERVLDVACGTGALAHAAAARVGEGAVTGLDANPSMLEVARERRPGITWTPGDAAKLPFPDASFDAVLCQAALMFFPDKPACLREMHRVAKPGGRIAVHVFGESAGYGLVAEILGEVAGSEEEAIMRSPFSLADTAELKGSFAQAGMPSARVETHSGTARFASLEDLVETEIEGWLLAGRVDTARFLAAARRRMTGFVTPEGVRIPLKHHVVVATR
jgi:ubiquinone/menaquinone biosynthesis C-methylase UbiE